MENLTFGFDVPENEPVRDYAPGSDERARLKVELGEQSGTVVEVPLVINGKPVYSGKTQQVVMPCEHGHILARVHQAGERDVAAAIDAAVRAREAWSNTPFAERAAVMLRAADLLAGPDRQAINAATMLGQGKSVHQAETDAACETIDYLRYNVHFASQIYAQQPRSVRGQLNRVEYRPLEGFVLAVSPFNFTAVASNLNMAPVLMGNTTVWKPAGTAVLSNYHLLRVFTEAGLPPGVVNFLPGSGKLVAAQALAHRDFGGLHFTGSNATFDSLWKGISEQIGKYRSYPRIVGETGGKDFIFAHASADPKAVAAAIVRGAFEYQGQKCSAASRAYVSKSVWKAVRDSVVEMLSRVKVGDVRDFGNFMNAVIDEPAFDKTMRYIGMSREAPDIEFVFGGTGDKSVGYYVQPTVLRTENPRYATMQEEIFGPVITVYVYDDRKFEETLSLCNSTSPYALTGSIFATDRAAISAASQALRYAAGNFYVNDKPTGAMIGLQPFGGSRGSGTNDKAGGPLNLLRWVSPRTLKETFVPATAFEYPFMQPDLDISASTIQRPIVRK